MVATIHGLKFVFLKENQRGCHQAVTLNQPPFSYHVHVPQMYPCFVSQPPCTISQRNTHLPQPNALTSFTYSLIQG